MEFELVEDLLVELPAEDGADPSRPLRAVDERDEPIWDWGTSSSGDRAVWIPEQEDG